MSEIKNINYHEPTLGIGTWRNIYLKFLNELSINSICEIGSGHPIFLEKVKAKKKLAIDYGDDFKELCENKNISFQNLDLDNDELKGIEEKFDAVVCSDVFEHLLNPKKTLNFCKEILSPDGLFFSHVPNEFNFRRLLMVMFFNKQSVFFHSQNEQNNPHLRRFTNVGYKEFLKQEFEFNLYISDMNYSGLKKIINSLQLSIPYGFQYGPTYISTNSHLKFLEVKSLKTSL